MPSIEGASEPLPRPGGSGGVQPRNDVVGEPESAAGPDCLSEGIHAYLQDIEGYRAVCRRHGGTATVEERDGGLRVERRFESTPETIGHLTSALGRLPRWRGHGNRKAGGGSQPPALVPGVVHEDPPNLVGCDIFWRGRRILVHACPEASAAVLRVDLFVYPWDQNLPELPLQTVAVALGCHEFLVPESVALPLPVSSGEGRGDSGIRAYLARAMPPNLYASQCI